MRWGRGAAAAKMDAISKIIGDSSGSGSYSQPSWWHSSQPSSKDSFAQRWQAALKAQRSNKKPEIVRSRCGTCSFSKHSSCRSCGHQQGWLLLPGAAPPSGRPLAWADALLQLKQPVESPKIPTTPSTLPTLKGAEVAMKTEEQPKSGEGLASMTPQQLKEEIQRLEAAEESLAATSMGVPESVAAQLKDLRRELHGRRPEGRQARKLTAQRTKQEETIADLKAQLEAADKELAKLFQEEEEAKQEHARVKKQLSHKDDALYLRSQDIEQAAAALTINLSNAMKDATSKGCQVQEADVATFIKAQLQAMAKITPEITQQEKENSQQQPPPPPLAVPGRASHERATQPALDDQLQRMGRRPPAKPAATQVDTPTQEEPGRQRSRTPDRNALSGVSSPSHAEIAEQHVLLQVGTWSGNLRVHGLASLRKLSRV